MDYKFILLTEQKQAKVRYRKKGESHWSTLELDDTDLDSIIAKLLKALGKNG